MSVRFRTCACGGSILASGPADESIALAVRLHNESARHAAYRSDAESYYHSRTRSGYPPVGDAMTRADSPDSEPIGEVRASRPATLGRVLISPDGYDFTVVPWRPS